MRWQTPSWNQEKIERPICVDSFHFCLFGNLLSWFGPSWIFFDYLELSSKWTWNFVQRRWTLFDVPHVCTTHVHVCGTHKAVFSQFLESFSFLLFCFFLSFSYQKCLLGPISPMIYKQRGEDILKIIILNKKLQVHDSGPSHKTTIKPILALI